jgi:hypothetical protein
MLRLVCVEFSVTADCWLSRAVCVLCPGTCGAVMADLTDVLFITSTDYLMFSVTFYFLVGDGLPFCCKVCGWHGSFLHDEHTMQAVPLM